MHFQKLAIVFALSAIGLAQDVDSNDIPPACQSVCGNIVSLTQNCDNTTNDDAAELNCVCTSPNAGTLIPLCAACISQNGDRDNDVQDIVRSCSFTSTTYVSSAAASALSSVAAGGSGTPASNSAAMTSNGGASPSSPTGNAVSQSVNAAPAQTMGAVAGLGALGVALFL